MCASLAHRNRFVAQPCQHLDVGADLLDAGGADEDAREGDVTEPLHGDVGFEGVHLASPAVATHREVEGARWPPGRAGRR